MIAVNALASLSHARTLNAATCLLLAFGAQLVDGANERSVRVFAQLAGKHRAD